MKISRILSIKRAGIVAGSVLSLAALSLFGFGSTVIPSIMGTAHAASCEYIENQSSGGYIVGHGEDNDVTLTSAGGGSCFTLNGSGKTDGFTWYTYQDQSGHCLYMPANSAYLELGGACNGSIAAEEMFGNARDSGGGWQFTSIAMYEASDGGGSLVENGSCSGYGQTVSPSQYWTCGGNWLFPSSD
jgi:hypothetical protein